MLLDDIIVQEKNAAEACQIVPLELNKGSSNQKGLFLNIPPL